MNAAVEQFFVKAEAEFLEIYQSIHTKLQDTTLLSADCLLREQWL